MIGVYQYTGPSQTEDGPLASLDFLSIDGVGDPSSYPVARGTSSFERWVRIKGGTVSQCWVSCSTLPPGVTIRVGTSDTYSTPTNAPSTIATKAMVAGERYYFQSLPASPSRFCVLQASVDPSASPGALAGVTVSFGWRA